MFGHYYLYYYNEDFLGNYKFAHIYSYNAMLNVFPFFNSGIFQLMLLQRMLWYTLKIEFLDYSEHYFGNFGKIVKNKQFVGSEFVPFNLQYGMCVREDFLINFKICVR